MNPDNQQERVHLYVDGSSQENRQVSGIAVVVLDQDGYVVAQTGRGLPYCSSLEAELRAIECALSYARDCGIPKFVICCDCGQAMNLLVGRWLPEFSDGTMSPSVPRLVRRLRKMLAGTPGAVVRQVPREENERADELARLMSRNASAERRQFGPSWSWTSADKSKK